MEPDISALIADAGNTAILALLLYRVLYGIERLASRVLDILDRMVKRLPDFDEPKTPAR